MTDWQRVIVESPYAGDILRNIAYARLACWWCLKNGMAPFASHLLYTQMLDDSIEGERELGMGAGMAWRHGAQLTIAFIDFGISSGMKAGMSHARKHEQDVREITLRLEMGDGKFADAMQFFEREVRRLSIDAPRLPKFGESVVARALRPVLDEHSTEREQFEHGQSLARRAAQAFTKSALVNEPRCADCGSTEIDDSEVGPGVYMVHHEDCVQLQAAQADHEPQIGGA